MLKPEVFWKQMCCIEESTHDIVGTFQRPRSNLVPANLLPPRPLLLHPCAALFFLLHSSSSIDDIIPFIGFLIWLCWSVSSGCLTNILSTSLPGPFKINGVPLRRINQVYVIATSTKVDISGVKLPDRVNDTYFRRKELSKPKHGEGEIFEGGQEVQFYLPWFKVTWLANPFGLPMMQITFQLWLRHMKLH